MAALKPEYKIKGDKMEIEDIVAKTEKSKENPIVGDEELQRKKRVPYPDIKMKAIVENDCEMKKIKNLLCSTGKSILVFGPEYGTSKIKLVSAVANELEIPYVVLNARHVQANQNDEYEELKKWLQRDCIIIIDDIDAAVHMYYASKDVPWLKNLLLEEITNVYGNTKAVIVGIIGTVHEEDEYKKLYRSFEASIYVRPPNLEARFALFKTILNQYKHTVKEKKIMDLAIRSKRYSKDDIWDVVKTSHNIAQAEELKKSTHPKASADQMQGVISKTHLGKAFDSSRPSIGQEAMQNCNTLQKKLARRSFCGKLTDHLCCCRDNFYDLD